MHHRMTTFISQDFHAFPLDEFRLAVAKVVEKALGIALETAFAGVDLGKKGCDFTVALPRFRIKRKPEELAQLVSDAVGTRRL
jgi:arginyl-tRNA synthetase